MGLSRNPRFVADGDVSGLVDEALRQQVMLAAIARLENEGSSPSEAERRLPNVLEEETANLRIPLTLGVPGVAPVYSRRAYDRPRRNRIEPISETDPADTWTIKILERPDTLIERSAIEFVTTHKAVATSGVGLVTPSVPAQAFIVLAELERHFSVMPRGHKVWRLLERLQVSAQPIWSDALTAAIGRAADLTVFSNFPLGLLRRGCPDDRGISGDPSATSMLPLLIE